MKTIHRNFVCEMSMAGLLAFGSGWVALAGSDASTAAPPKWTIHEWGTFTSLQDEHGDAIGGINTDDEKVPGFVHEVANSLLLYPSEMPVTFFQGVPHCHPDVTMRLETPVLYFHPPTNAPTAHDVTVKAAFRGGWLTEYYPDAAVEAPGVNSNSVSFSHLRADTVGSLTWQSLEVGGDWPGPQTGFHVWNAPRAVQAANVRTANHEADRFLFYRGVAHIDAPLRVVQENGMLTIKSQLPSDLAAKGALTVPALWLADILDDGRIAVRNLPGVTLDGTGKTLTQTTDHFAVGDYSTANLEFLRSMLHAALMKEGLYADEASALLNTWELSYFQSSGMRVFFIVPRAWTDHYLPLDISLAADVSRAMVGRIELVSPRQRNLLSQLARTTPKEVKEDLGTLDKNIRNLLDRTNVAHARAYGDVADGKMTLAQAGVTVPRSYQLYLQLGRFRNALALEEAKRNPTAGLKDFIREYQLEGYEPVSSSGNGN